MSGLRYFDDIMTRQIEIERNARFYADKCVNERSFALKQIKFTSEIIGTLQQANEGLCAVRIIMGKQS